MAFRDQSEALRARLEAAERRVAQLERQNADLGAKHSPLVRGLAVALGVVIVLGTGLAWHLAMQNTGLSLTVRRDEQEIAAMRSALDETIVARANADNAVIAAEADCRERTDRAQRDSHRRTLEAMRADPRSLPSGASLDRYYWIDEVEGRSDLALGDPCLVSVGRGAGGCSLEVRCGPEELELVPLRMEVCVSRPDGWVNITDHDGSLRIALRGPQLGVRDEAGTWSVMLANDRPCR